MQQEDGDLAVAGLTKEFVSEAGRLTILNGVGLKMRRGEALAVTGPSGSGKSTLLHILGMLDRPTSGSVRLLGEDPFAAHRRTARRFSQRQDRLRLSGPSSAAAVRRARKRVDSGARRRRGRSGRIKASDAAARASRFEKSRDPSARSALGRGTSASRCLPGPDQSAGAAPGRRADRQPRPGERGSGR